ncbi:MAG TPA: SdpI family protein [Gemmatales bacterium]|nr:SdpI family protein [Gemmatales bacterium]HMP60974.1 SdpI family protein [Gemmatales bacterium]
MKSRWLVVGVLLTLSSFAASLWVWSQRAELMPASVPTHWNAQGEPDQFTPREEMFWVLLIGPLIQLSCLALIPALLWLSPKEYAFEEGTRIYYYVMTLVLVFFSYLNGVLLMSYTHAQTDFAVWLFGGMHAFFILLGNVLGKVPRNFWMGIRVPWTLTSSVVWNKTHRLAGWMWVASGLLGLGLILLGINPFWTLIPLAFATLGPIVYSAWLYKKLEREGRLEAAA